MRASLLLPAAGLAVGAAVPAASATSASVVQEAAGPPRPNVVFVLADDLGWGDVGHLNPSSGIPTPRIDALAAEGMHFGDAHAPAAVCSPTRYALLTGRYAWRGRLRRGVVLPWEPPVLEDERLTLAEMFAGAGYHTVAIGKWHLGWDWPPVPDRPGSVDLTQPIGGGPLAHGFAEFFGQDVPHFPPYAWIEGDRLTELPEARTPMDFFGDPGPMVEGWDPEAVLPATARRAVAEIEEHAQRADGRPLFLWFALTAPHTPIVPTEPFRGASEAGPYGDFVCQVDAVLGEVLDALEEHDLARETLVVFASDNGSPARTTSWADIGTVQRAYDHDPSGGWRGLKADVWEGGHRVPLVVRWPGHVAEGARSDEAVCLVDWMATLAALLEVELPHDAAEDSFDLSPLLLGRELEGPARGPIVHQTFHGMLGIRDGNWKLCFGLGSGGWSEPVWIPPAEDGPVGQLYDLASDPEEATNRFADEPEVVQRLEEELRTMIAAGRSAPAREAARDGAAEEADSAEGSDGDGD